MAVYSFTRQENVRVLRVSGPLEQPDAQTFKAELERATTAAGAMPIIVDLSRLEKIGSAAMRLLAQFTKRMAERGQAMITVGMSGVVREVVEMCGMDTLLKIAPTTDEALADLSRA
ncbi:MAG: STAS domain-containing protein [Pseudomonadota bacterium]